MKKSERIKSKIEFDNLIKNSKYNKNKYYVIYISSKKEEKSRYGIAVGTKVGNAVIRNKLKRRIREIIKETKTLFKNDKDYIIIVRKPCLEISYQAMKENLIDLIK